MPHDVEANELTGPQLVSGTLGLGMLTNPLPASAKTYRTMRMQPTLALARAMTTGPIVASEWSVERAEEASEDWVKLIKAIFLPMREPVLQTTVEGQIDFGWQPWEKIFALVDGQVWLRKLKPLLQDHTEILVGREHGEFLGFQQNELILPLENSMLFSHQVEGTQWYGRSTLENARIYYNEWIEADAVAARYDKTVAGSRFVITYPVGQSIVEGVMKDNAIIAKEFLGALEKAGSIAIPGTVAETIKELENQSKLAWHIDILSDKKAGQISFAPRLEYLDKLLVRALFLPERALLEGRFGTKADATAHADFALTHMDLTHRQIVRHLNWHAVDQILALNFGESARGTVWIEAASLARDKRDWFQKVYETILADPVGIVTELDELDVPALRESSGLPTRPEDEQANVPELDATDVDNPAADIVEGATNRARIG